VKDDGDHAFLSTPRTDLPPRTTALLTDEVRVLVGSESYTSSDERSRIICSKSVWSLMTGKLVLLLNPSLIPASRSLSSCISGAFCSLPLCYSISVTDHEAPYSAASLIGQT